MIVFLNNKCFLLWLSENICYKVQIFVTTVKIMTPTPIISQTVFSCLFLSILFSTKAINSVSDITKKKRIVTGNSGVLANGVLKSLMPVM